MNGLREMLEHEASTRTAALVRIGVALLLWARFAGDVAPFVDHSPARLLLASSFYLSTTGMLFGVYSRWTTAWAGATTMWMVYGVGPSSMEPWTHHHTTLLAHATALLALTPCGRSYSWDRWRALRAGAAPPERGPTWGLTLIAVQLTVLYLSTAFDKCTAAFLSGERLQHAFMTLYWGADPVTIPGFAALCMISAWVVVLLEVTLPVGMWFRRAQPVLIPLGLLLHAIFYVAVPVGTFSLTMAVLYLAWLDPDPIHDAIDRLQA